MAVKRRGMRVLCSAPACVHAAMCACAAAAACPAPTPPVHPVSLSKSLLSVTKPGRPPLPCLFVPVLSVVCSCPLSVFHEKSVCHAYAIVKTPSSCPVCVPPRAAAGINAHILYEDIDMSVSKSFITPTITTHVFHVHHHHDDDIRMMMRDESRQ